MSITMIVHVEAVFERNVGLYCKIQHLLFIVDSFVQHCGHLQN